MASGPSSGGATSVSERRETMLDTHGKDEAPLSRFQAVRIDRAALENLIKQPNEKKKDEYDQQKPKIRRWVLMEIEGVIRRVRVVFVVIHEKTDTDPGEIRVVTVIPEGA